MHIVLEVVGNPWVCVKQIRVHLLKACCRLGAGKKWMGLAENFISLQGRFEMSVVGQI